MKTNTEVIRIYLSKELKDRITLEAQRYNTPVSGWIKWKLIDALPKKTNEIGEKQDGSKQF